MKCIYLIGSLRNPEIPRISESLRDDTTEIFDEWIAAGPEADDCWRDYEKARKHTYSESLRGHPARHVFTFDEFHLNRAHGAVLVYPAGKSGHLELGYIVGQGKPGFILLDGIPDRYDVMKQFATGGIFTDEGSLKQALLDYPWPTLPTLPKVLQHDAMWLAGLLEGEGCFTISKSVPRLVLQMTDQDIVQRAATILASGVWGGTRLTKGGKKVWTCGRAGITAIEWMRILKPYMGVRRKQRIVEVVSKWLERKTYRQSDKQYWASIFGL